MSTRTDVLLWAQRTLGRKGSPPHVLLEITEHPTPEQLQDAFHKIARTAHPDLHRHGLSASELELVTSAYATVAGAYAELRGTMQTPRLRSSSDDLSAAQAEANVATQSVTRAAAATPAAGARVVQPSPPADVLSSEIDPTEAMSPKALPYFRKAEVCLKRGDLKGAILQLKLAVNTDPTSAFLRTTLADAEAVARSGTP